jgi:hypothetical protein
MAQKNRANMLTDIVSNIYNNLINFITGQNAQDRFVNLLDSSPNILSDASQANGYVSTDANNEMFSSYYDEEISRADLITDLTANLAVGGKFYRINDAVGNTITLLVIAESNINLYSIGTDITTGEQGTYDITTDVFTPIVVSGTPTLQQVTDAGFTTTNKIESSDGAGNATTLNNGVIDITTGDEIVTIEASLVTTAYTAQLPNKLSSPQTFAMLSDVTGGGDVVGPASAVSNNITLFDGTTGKLIKDGGVALSALVPYTGATADVDLDNNGLNAKFVKIKGTAGNGHLNLKHQSSGATAGGSESVLYADNSGNPAWKNDGNALQSILTNSNITQVITNGVTDKAPSEDAVFDALALKTNTYSINVISQTLIAPADATSYHFGLSIEIPATTTLRREFKFPQAGTMTAFSFNLLQATNGSSETCTLYLRNTTTSTDYTIGTFTSDFGLNGALKTLYSGLSIAVNTTDNWAVKILTPTWGTNPANWIPQGLILITT